MALAAYGFAMANFTLAGDEWFSVFPESTLDTDYALWAGRWVMPLVWAVTGNGAMAPFVTLAVGPGAAGGWPAWSPPRPGASPGGGRSSPWPPSW